MAFLSFVFKRKSEYLSDPIELEEYLYPTDKAIFLSSQWARICLQNVLGMLDLSPV